MTARITIEGIQEASAANRRIIEAMKPDGALGRALKWLTTEAHRRATVNTPWDTGGLRNAHRMKVNGLRGEVYLDSSAVNPRQGGSRPAEYGFHLHGQGMRPGLRGGIRAFYQYTAERDGPDLVKRAGEMVRKELP